MHNHARLNIKRLLGASTLVMALILMTLAMIIIIYAGNYGRLQSHSIANIGRQQQAFNAAEAGLEFGINYLTANNAAILANPVSGYLAPYSNASTTNVVLANNSQFSITYTNPVVNNYELIKITSVGLSDDGSATSTVSQLVQFGSLLLNVPTSPLISLGTVNLGGNSEVTNIYSGTTVVSGQAVNMSGSSSTVLSTGISSTPGNIQSDIEQSNPTLSGQSTDDFFSAYFGQSAATIQGAVEHYYTSTSSTNYSSTLDGMTGTSIWIDQPSGSTTLNGNTTIGSAANPVLLVINGDIRFSGDVTIYGYVYVNGTTSSTLLGRVHIIGSIGSAGPISAASGSVEITYSPSVLDNLQNNASMRYYAKVPGSWKDY